MAQGPMMPKMPQMDLIAELKKRQVKPQVTDGAIEDIITGTDEAAGAFLIYYMYTLFLRHGF